ncbi:MAG: sensor histidine kinase [Cytophagales bacterium]
MKNFIVQREEKIRKKVDQYGKVAAVILVVSTIPDVYFQIWQNVLVVAFMVAYFLVLVYLNKKSKATFFGTLLSIGVNGMTFYASVSFGELSRAYLFYLPLIIGTFLVTNYRNKLEIVLNVGHIVVGIFLLDFLDLDFLRDKSIENASIVWFGKFNTILALVAAIYFFIGFIKEISENEEKLLQSTRQLEDQNDELLKKNEELDRLIYSISHDIKAPLSSIEGLVCVTKLENNQPTLNEYFDRMISSTKRLKNFLENVIDFYKNTKFELIPEKIDFDHEIDLILQNLKYAPNFKDIDFMVDINQSSIVKLDKMRVQTILINLLSNAIKYQNEEIEHKKIEIAINIDKGIVKIEVSDNGIGIPNEIQDKIFEMFYRGTVKSDGSGLGLYILSESVKKLNGKIALASVPTVYTKFTVEIPFISTNEL